jgi:hypothetical protein
MYDKRGQWMLVSGVLIAFVIISMSVYLNEIALSGTRISYSPHTLPYYEIRSLIVELTRAYKNGDIDSTNNVSVAENITMIYALHGYDVDVEFKSWYNFLNIYANYTCVNFSTEYMQMEVNKSVVRYG